MSSSNLLMQYQSECLEALKSAAKISKPFEKVFMDTLKLFMAIPGDGQVCDAADQMLAVCFQWYQLD